MKSTLILTAAMIGGIAIPTAVLAGPFGLPDHKQNGYRDTGCDPAFQVQITNDAGKYLYSNNPTCPMGGGTVAAVAHTPEEVAEPVKGDK
jgi:hypothetical protein